MPDSVYVLGLDATHGDVSAVLLRDGAVVAALEEERFRRIEHHAGFLTESIQCGFPVDGGHLVYPSPPLRLTVPSA